VQYPRNREWEDLTESQASRDDADDESRWLSEDDRERLAAPAVEALSAMPEFRAAKRGARQRLAKLHPPSEMDRRVRWDAVRTACDRAGELTQRYADVDGRYDELASRLVTDPAYQRLISRCTQAEITRWPPHLSYATPTDSSTGLPYTTLQDATPTFIDRRTSVDV
jgi:hypothetical protein